MSWVTLALVLAAGPPDWALPGFRVHVEASEELDADRLRALARPEVVLWVRTRSNGLRRSTAETLQTGRMRRSCRCGRRSARRRSPRSSGGSGPWVDERGVDVARVRRWSPGRLAVDVEGPFTEELAARLRVLRPVAVRWARGGWPDAAEWARARGFSGVELDGPGAAPVGLRAPFPPRSRIRVRVPVPVGL